MSPPRSSPRSSSIDDPRPSAVDDPTVGNPVVVGLTPLPTATVGLPLVDTIVSAGGENVTMHGIRFGRWICPTTEAEHDRLDQ